jgi:putative sigma-54 modulation protein
MTPLQPDGRHAAVQIKIAARHGHLSESHQAEIREKATKLLHYFDRITMIEVTVDLQDKIYKEVEILVNAEHKHDFVARERHEELFAAMELAVDKIKQQIHRYKERIQNHRRDPARGANEE